MESRSCGGAHSIYRASFGGARGPRRGIDRGVPLDLATGREYSRRSISYLLARCSAARSDRDSFGFDAPSPRRAPLEATRAFLLMIVQSQNHKYRDENGGEI